MASSSKRRCHAIAYQLEPAHKHLARRDFLGSISRAYKLLSLRRNLKTCRLEIGHNTGPFETSKDLISLPFLTSLSVREINIDLSRLFSLLHLSSLQYIEFYTTILPMQQTSTSPLSLLTRFFNTIQMITDAVFFTRQDFITCLRLCPLLKSLYIWKPYGVETPLGGTSCKIDDAILKLFFESSDEGYLCPHLEGFESSSETAFSESTLQFVKEKNGDTTTTTTTTSTTGLAELKLLFVVFRCRPVIDIKQELKPFEQAGLVTSLTYPLRTNKWLETSFFWRMELNDNKVYLRDNNLQPEAISHPM